MSTIHICYLTGVYNRRDALIFYRHGISMAQKGHKVTVIVCDEEPNEVVDGIQIISTQFKPLTYKDRFIKTRKLLLQLADKVDADIYQLCDPEHIPLVKYFLRNKKQVVFNVREFYPKMIAEKQYIPKWARKYCVIFFEWMMRHYLPKYGAVFAVTPELVNELKDKYGAMNTLLVTNFPIPDNDFVLTKEEYLNRPNVLMYEGTIYHESKQENILDAIRTIPDIRYLLVGVFVGPFETIQSHSEWHRVEFINGFTKEQLKGFFARSTMANTLREYHNNNGSLGVIKIFESMEAALPVIFADVPLYRYIVDKYKCGVCADINNVKSIEKAIRYLVDHKEEAYEMGQNGRQAVLAEFNWWKQFEVYESSLTSLVENR